MTDFRNAAEAREALAAKQTALAAIFTESKYKKDDGSEGYDFNKVKSISGVSGSIAIAEHIAQSNAELDEIAQKAEKLEDAEKAAASLAAREKAIRRPGHANPDPDAGQKGGRGRIKSIGERVEASPEFQAWVKGGCAGGIPLQFPEMTLSDFLAPAGKARTLGEKTLFQTSAGWDPEYFRQPGFVEAVSRPIQLLDIIPTAMTNTDTISYMLESTRTHSAAEKAEGGTYAESTFALTETTSPVRKITDSLPVTDEQLADVAQVSSYIDGRLRFGIRQRLDSEVLLGNGTPPNLTGIANAAGIQTQAKGADTIASCFYKAMTLVRVTGRAMPTHHIIHPTDWQTVRLSTTADGIYLWGSPSESGPDRMWGLPVVQCDAGSAGTGYVGSFMPSWISLFERSGIDVQIGYTGTQFVEGKRTVRADLRAALAIFRPAAFASCTGL